MFLHDPLAAPNAFKLTQEAASRLVITLQAPEVEGTEEQLPELATVAKERVDALFAFARRSTGGQGTGESAHCDANATLKLNRLVYGVW